MDWKRLIIARADLLLLIGVPLVLKTMMFNVHLTCQHDRFLDGMIRICSVVTSGPRHAE